MTDGEILAAAREAVARQHEDMGLKVWAESIRAGNFDLCMEIRLARQAIEAVLAPKVKKREAA